MKLKCNFAQVPDLNGILFFKVVNHQSYSSLRWRAFALQPRPANGQRFRASLRPLAAKQR
jgi:hypothetical protein